MHRDLRHQTAVAGALARTLSRADDRKRIRGLREFEVTFPTLLMQLQQLEFDYDDGEGIDFDALPRIPTGQGYGRLDQGLDRQPRPGGRRVSDLRSGRQRRICGVLAGARRQTDPRSTLAPHVARWDHLSGGREKCPPAAAA